MAQSRWTPDHHMYMWLLWHNAGSIELCKNVFECCNVAVSLHWKLESQICSSMRTRYAQITLSTVGVMLRCLQTFSCTYIKIHSGNLSQVKEIPAQY